MNELISIIVPVYNRANVIRECIHSVLIQSYRNWELILVDDGSVDQSLEICRSMAEKDSRIRLYSTEHTGVSGARNKALDEAQGSYIFFLDSDDTIHHNLLETILNGMNSHNAAIAGTERINIRQKQWRDTTNKLMADNTQETIDFLSNKQALDVVFRTTTPINIIGGVMMRRDLVGDTRFSNELFIGEDFYFVYQNLIKGADVIFVGPNRYYSRIHSENISWNHSFEGFWSRFYRRKLIWESETALGRQKNANDQKLDALDVYLRCMKYNAPGTEDFKRMQKIMKEHKKVLASAFTLKKTMLYFFSVYTPKLYLKLFTRK